MESVDLNLSDDVPMEPVEEKTLLKSPDPVAEKILESPLSPDEMQPTLEQLLSGEPHQDLPKPIDLHFNGEQFLIKLKEDKKNELLTDEEIISDLKEIQEENNKVNIKDDDLKKMNNTVEVSDDDDVIISDLKKIQEENNTVEISDDDMISGLKKIKEETVEVSDDDDNDFWSARTSKTSGNQLKLKSLKEIMEDVNVHKRKRNVIELLSEDDDSVDSWDSTTGADQQMRKIELINRLVNMTDQMQEITNKVRKTTNELKSMF